MVRVNFGVSRAEESRKIILHCNLSPGDVLVLTAAIKSLHDRYPGKFLTDVRSPCDPIFENNPYITRLEDSDAEHLELHYTEMINRSNQVPNSFLRGYTVDLGQRLGMPLELTTNRPNLWLSEEERSWVNQVKEHHTKSDGKFWVMSAGVKSDFTLKQWPVEYYQEVVDHFRGKIQFVQIGEKHHRHPELRGVIRLVGETDLRQLIRLCWWAEGGLGPITLIQHVFAAFEKPYVALLGGREPVSWVQYPRQTTLHTIGALKCCLNGACWKSRVVPMNDGGDQDNSLCEQPILGLAHPIGRCMAIIKPVDVIRAIDRYYDGGSLAH